MSLIPDSKITNKFVFDTRSKITPVMQQWYFLKSKYSETVLYFRMGDFYELFNEDAKLVAPLLDLKLTTRGTDPEGNPIPLAGIPVKALNNYLPQLIEKKIPVAIVEQIGNPIKIKSKEFFPRDVVRVITPGTVLIPELLPSKGNNYFLSIHTQKEQKSTTWAWALVDVSTGEFKIAEYKSSDLLLSEIYRLQPTEVLLSPSTSDNEYFISELDKQLPMIHKTYGDEYDYDIDKSKQKLNALFKTNSLDGFGISNYQVSISAAGALLTILERRKVPFNALKIQYHQSANYLLIDSIARKNLELETNLHDNSIKSTLLEVIDQTATFMGGRLLRSWLRQPLISKSKINKRLEVISVFLKEYNLRQELNELLMKIRDIERIVSRIYYRSANPMDLIRLLDSLLIVPFLRVVLSKFNSNNPEIINLRSQLQPIPEVVKIVKNAIIDGTTTFINDGGFIKKGYSLKLDELRDISKNSKVFLLNFQTEEQIRINELARKRGKKDTKIKVNYTRGHGYYIEIRSDYPVPDNYTIVRALKDRTRYATSELLQTANKIITADEESVELEKTLFKELLIKLENYLPQILRLSKLISKLDVLVTFAHIANAYNYNRPVIVEETNISIEEGRHPIIERILPYGDFVPNDTLLDQNNRLLIISGANMGGKSVYLKMNALIVILAQMGSFVPASKAIIGIVDRIFTRVGIIDDIFKGQSHFMVEMIETANLINNATTKSLILLDELGRGTATNTGMAIAWAVAKFIHDHVKARTLFATHFHQLNTMDNQFSGIKNYHVSVKYNKGTLIFLHKVVPGGTDESYGLEVAELAGFPRELLNDAKYTRELIDQEQFFKSNLHLTETHKSLANNSKIRLEEGLATQKETKNDKNSKQISLNRFFEDKEWIEIKKLIKSYDLNNMTPVQALHVLLDLKKRISK